MGAEQALATLQVMTAGAQPIALEEYRQRIAQLQQLMQAREIAAVFVDAGSSLSYFTGLKWSPSERLVGVLIPARGEVRYLAPAFEEGTVRDLQVLPGSISVWAEHESPFALLVEMLTEIEVGEGARVGLSHSLPFGMYERLRQVASGLQLVDAGALIEQCRRCKSPAELALMQRAKDMTLEVHKAAASILREGITTTEVTRFIEAAHRKVGAPGSTFCIVLFGEDSAFPHGVRQPRPLRDGDMVLIDTGCQLFGYHSDITRSYVFGAPSARPARASVNCGTWRRPRNRPRSMPRCLARLASRSMPPHGVAWRRAASARTTRCRACRTARGTALAWISTKVRTWCAVTARRWRSACASATSR